MIAIEYSENMYVLDEQVMATISAFQNGISQSSDNCKEKGPSAFVCTRNPDHKGVHIASSSQVVAVWGEGKEGR